LHQAGLLALPHFLTFPCEQWFCGRNVLQIAASIYSYGDSAGIKPDFPFNEISLTGFQPNALRRCNDFDFAVKYLFNKCEYH
jgi:hypothetical protein